VNKTTFISSLKTTVICGTPNIMKT